MEQEGGIMRGRDYAIYFCPSCGEKSVWELEGSCDLKYCECGMVWRPMTSSICYDADTSVREQVRDAIDKTLQVYMTKKEEVNEQRIRQKERAVNKLTVEVMKGPIEGGTLAPPPVEGHMFGTDQWHALQKAVLIRDSMCRICGQKPSQEVHHIRPRHLKGQDHPRNLIGLCLDCHDEVHRRIDNGIQEVCVQSLKIKPPKAQTTLEDVIG